VGAFTCNKPLEARPALAPEGRPPTPGPGRPAPVTERARAAERRRLFADRKQSSGTSVQDALIHVVIPLRASCCAVLGISFTKTVPAYPPRAGPCGAPRSPPRRGALPLSAQRKSLVNVLRPFSQALRVFWGDDPPGPPVRAGACKPLRGFSCGFTSSGGTTPQAPRFAGWRPQTVLWFLLLVYVFWDGGGARGRGV
jgi:hypothetical protein